MTQKEVSYVGSGSKTWAVGVYEPADRYEAGKLFGYHRFGSLQNLSENYFDIFTMCFMLNGNPEWVYRQKVL